MTNQAAAASIVKTPRWLIVDGVVNPTNLAAGQTLSVLQTIPQDADFEWWWALAYRTSGLLKLQIQDQGSQRSFVYDQSGNIAASGIYIDLFGGLASNNGAFPMTIPYVMPANRKYAWNFTDESGAANTVEIALSGYALLQISS